MIEEYISIFAALGMTIEFTDTSMRVQGKMLEKVIEIDNPLGRRDQDIILRGVLLRAVTDLVKPGKVEPWRFTVAQTAALSLHPELDRPEIWLLLASVRLHLERQGVLVPIDKEGEAL